MTAQRTLAVFTFLVVVACSAAAVPGASGTLSLLVHPALISGGVQPALAAAPLPLGLVTHAVDLLDLGAYAAGSRTEPTVDLGSFILRLANVEVLAVMQPSSPDLISLDLSADRVQLTSSGGDFDVVGLLNQVSASPQRAALDNPVLPVYWFSAGTMRFDLGYLISAVPLDGVAGATLLDLLSGGATAPDTRYGITLRSVADFSLALRATYGVPLDVGHAVVRPAISLTVPLSLAHAESIAETWVETGPDGIPQGFGNSWDLLYWYPGTGVGVGAKTSAGVSVKSGGSTLAFTLWSFYSGWWAQGVRAGTTDSQPETISESTFGISPILAYVGTKHIGVDRTATIALQAGYRNTLVGSVSVVWSGGPVSVVAGIGYDHGVRIGAGFGVEGRRLYVEPAFEARTNKNTGTSLVGLTVSLARIPGGSGRNR